MAKKMIVVSNHLRELGMEFPKDAVVRVNLAWVPSPKICLEIVRSIKNEVMLDYPSFRLKPPCSCNISPRDIENIAINTNNVRYLAVSNADFAIMNMFNKIIPGYVELVPKIESLDGIKSIDLFKKLFDIGIVMLDKEDLYVNCECSNEKYYKALSEFNKICKKTRITPLTLYGVVFGSK